ncbi:hypothetical protein NRB56_69660 [Nocardia sp. RB56]|uniref:Uncharacterized protein n=1 Tax=Nocardia aurantia TaxID=2585199 RepID=A0A7K0E0Q1_9NOCA|nr:hypothetical protein [Nocardia aurantia]
MDRTASDGGPVGAVRAGGPGRSAGIRIPCRGPHVAGAGGGSIQLVNGDSPVTKTMTVQYPESLTAMGATVVYNDLTTSEPRCGRTREPDPVIAG